MDYLYRAFSRVHQRATHIMDTLDHWAETGFSVFATLPKNLGWKRRKEYKKAGDKNE